MADPSALSGKRFSRRDFLFVGAVGSGAAISLGLSGSVSAAPKKFTQQQAHYQPIPKSGQRCQNCALWQSPKDCQVVEGPVSPAGWCILYQAKG